MAQNTPTNTSESVTAILTHLKFTRFAKYELEKKIETNKMKINILYNK